MRSRSSDESGVNPIHKSEAVGRNQCAVYSEPSIRKQLSRCVLLLSHEFDWLIARGEIEFATGRSHGEGHRKES